MSSHNFLQDLIDIKTKNSSIDGLDESFAILNLNYSIEYSSHSFNSFFHTDSSLQISFTSLTKLRPQAEKVEKLIKLSIENQLIIKFIYFVVSDNILHAKLFEIRPITNQITKEIFAIYISTIPYKEYGLIFQGLQQNNASKTFMGIITSFSKRKQKKHIELLTDFQLTICYLVVHNYSNAKIAEIINQLNNDRKRNTRAC